MWSALEKKAHVWKHPLQQNANIFTRTWIYIVCAMCVLYDMIWNLNAVEPYLVRIFQIVNITHVKCNRMQATGLDKRYQSFRQSFWSAIYPHTILYTCNKFQFPILSCIIIELMCCASMQSLKHPQTFDWVTSTSIYNRFD